MTYIPTNLYEVRLYDRDGNFIFIPVNITRIEFHQRLNASWNHQITVEMSKDDAHLEEMRSVQDDWYIRIFRIDPYTKIRTLVYSGLHITTVDQARSTGDIIFNFYGSGYTQLLSRRVVVPPTTNENSDKSGVAETVIKSYITDSMIAPTDTDRIFEDFRTEIDEGTGENVEYSTRFINLLTVCENVANAGKVDFGVIEDGEIGKVKVRVRPVWGKDKREGNAEGNTPVVLSFLFGNMDIPIYSKNTSDEKNFIYIGGPGQGTDRQIEEINSFPATPSKWNRKEAFIEARQQDTTDAMLSVGYAYLEDKKQTEKLSFDIIQTVGTRWLVDWELGDLITARYFDKVFDKKIVEVGVVVSGQSSSDLIETVSVEMEDVRI